MLNGCGSTILGCLAHPDSGADVDGGGHRVGFAGCGVSPVAHQWLALLGETYATVIRGPPDLVLILLIFTAVGTW